MALVDIVADSELEQLVWDDIQNDGLDTVCQRHTDIETGSNKIAPANPSAACSPSVSSMSEHETSTGVTAALARATDDAGSGSATVLAFAAEGTVPLQISAGGVASSAQLADMGPFASLEHCSLALGSAPSVGLALHRAGSLNLNPSMVTYKTRALAAAAGSVRNGAVGSNLRLAAVMLRSNSGGLAETLISEQARAESGLLTASLGRCDSLPELCLAPSGGIDMVDMMALRDMDAFSGMPSCAGLPSLSMLFSERPDFGAIAGTAADAQQQQRMGACPASAAPDSTVQAATGPDGMWEETGVMPGWISGSRFLGRPPSFSANGAAALFAGGSNAQPPQSPVHGLPLQASGPSGGRQGEALKPPSLVDYSQMLMQKDPAPAVPAAAAFAAPGRACAPAQPDMGAAAVASALGFEAFSLPSFGRMQPLLMDRQDTFELLMRQVEQEITAEAEVKQYAALEMGTIEVPARSQAAAPAGAVPPFIDEAAAAAAVPAVLRAAAESAAAPAPAPKRRSVFELARPSVFEGHTALGPAGVSAVSAGGPPAPVLDTLGPSFANWVPPSDPSNASQMSAATVAAGAATTSAGAAAASAGASAAPSSPFCLPTNTALLAGGDNSTASAPVDSGATELVKQDVARYVLLQQPVLRIRVAWRAVHYVGGLATWLNASSCYHPDCTGTQLLSPVWAPSCNV